MARLFDDAQNEYLYLAQAAVTGTPLGVSAWVNSDDDTLFQTAFWLGNKDHADKWLALWLRGDEVGDPAGLFRHRFIGGNQEQAATSSGYTVGTWHQICGFMEDDTHVNVLIDAGSKGTHTPTGVIVDIDAMAIGMARDTTPGGAFSGLVAEVALYNLSGWPGATGADKVAAWEASAVPGLAAGFSPLFWPLGLSCYWPLGGIFGQHDNDIVGGYDMAAFSDAAGPGWVDHPPIIYPSQAQVVQLLASVGNPWYYYAQQAG